MYSTWSRCLRYFSYLWTTHNSGSAPGLTWATVRIHHWILDDPLWRIVQNCAGPRALLFAVVGSALYVAGAGAMLIPYERDSTPCYTPFDDTCFLRLTLLLAIPSRAQGGEKAIQEANVLSAVLILVGSLAFLAAYPPSPEPPRR